MNSTIVTHRSINQQSVAFQFGQRDAQAGAICCPEMVFLARQQQVEYAAGYEAIKGVTPTTRQFTGNALPAPVIVPQLKRNSDREFVRKIDGNIDAIFKAAERHTRRLDAMLAADPSGELLWAV
jgi:hypothetical protein